MKQLIQALSIVLTITSSCARQTKIDNKTMNTMDDKTEQDTTYLLREYLINPAKKTVSLYEMTGGSETLPDGSVVHWEGCEYKPDTTINYDSTTLFIVGNQIFFKEHITRDPYSHFIPPHFDFNSLKVIYSDNEHLLCRDKNYLYQQEYTIKYQTIKLSGYKVINDYIYQKNNELYFLPASGEDLKKIEGVTLDIPSLKHLMDNYFADKNGLYLLGGYSYLEDNTSYGYEKSVRLEKSNGKTIIPVVKKNYLIYDDKVYSPAQWTKHKPLPLNAKKIKELELNNYYQICLLADDRHVFETKGNDGYSTAEHDIRSCNERYDSDFFKKNVNQWQVITEGDMNFVQENNGKTLYFPSEIKPFGGQIQAHILIKTPTGFYIFDEGNGSSLQAIDKVFIFNFDIQRYEELDASSYRYISENLRIYKNHLYGYDGLPIKEKTDMENLHFITYHNIKTHYLTDGKLLIYMGGGSYALEGEGGKTMQILERQIISDVDFSTLKVITKDILTDKDNIYSGNYDGISLIPIKALNLDVKIFLEE